MNPIGYIKHIDGMGLRLEVENINEFGIRTFDELGCRQCFPASWKELESYVFSRDGKDWKPIKKEDFIK